MTTVRIVLALLNILLIGWMFGISLGEREPYRKGSIVLKKRISSVVTTVSGTISWPVRDNRVLDRSFDEREPVPACRVFD